MTTVDLSERELAILRGLADGKTLTQIAKELRRARATIEPFYRRMLSQLGARNDAQAVDIGHRLGLLGDPAPVVAEPAFQPPPIRRVYDPPAVTAFRRHQIAADLAGGRPRAGTRAA